MRVLGLETSCDETGLAIYDSEAANSENRGIIAQVLYSQIELHATYGGVVPELASRDHIRKLVPLLNQLLEQSGLKKTDIDAIAFTKGPGLVGALMTGALFGRSLAMGLGIPAIGVHHMEGHLLAPLLGENAPEFPLWRYSSPVVTPCWWRSKVLVSTKSWVSRLMMRQASALTKPPKCYSCHTQVALISPNLP